MGVKNKIDDVRNLLIEGMERLLDPDDKFGAAEGTALHQLGKTLVDSAKAEVMAAKLLGAKQLPSKFIDIQATEIPYEEKPRQLSPKEIDQLGS